MVAASGGKYHGEIFNIYCDESCHLENDASNVMILGAISCVADHKDAISQEFRELVKTIPGARPGACGVTRRPF